MSEEEQKNGEKVTEKEDFDDVYQLSDQALGSIMLALQKGIAEQTEVEDIMREFNLVPTEVGLKVENPPVFEASDLDPDPEFEDEPDEDEKLVRGEDL